MTLSLSPFVCSFVHSSVRTLFFLLVSLKFFLVLKSFNCVSRKFQGCLKLEGGSSKFQGCFKEMLRVFQGSFKGVSSKIEWCSSSFKGVSRVFESSLKGVLGKFQ